MTIEASFTFSKLLDGFFCKLLDATEHVTIAKFLSWSMLFLNSACPIGTVLQAKPKL